MILRQNFQGADQLWESHSCIIFEVTPCAVHATFDSSLPCCFTKPFLTSTWSCTTMTAHAPAYHERDKKAECVSKIVTFNTVSG